MMTARPKASGFFATTPIDDTATLPCQMEEMSSPNMAGTQAAKIASPEARSRSSMRASLKPSNLTSTRIATTRP